MCFDLIRLIVRYYIAFFVTTVIAFILSAIYAYGYLPSLYKSHVMFEPGSRGDVMFDPDDDNYKNKIHFIPPSDLSKKINNGEYDTRLARRLGITAVEFDWSVTNLKDSSWIKVSIYQREKNRGSKLLNGLLSEIESDIKRIADAWRQTLALKIESLKESVKVLEAQKKLLEVKIHELEKKLQLSRKDKTLIREVQLGELSNKTNNSNVAGAILFNVAIQQVLTSDVELLMITKDMMEDRFSLSILQNELDTLREIEILGQVDVSDISDQPNRLAIVAALTALGFLCSFVVVLVIDTRKNTVV